MIKLITAFMLLIIFMPAQSRAADDYVDIWDKEYNNPFDNSRSKISSPYYEKKESSEDKYKSDKNKTPVTELSNDSKVKGSSSQSVMRNLMTKKR